MTYAALRYRLARDIRIREVALWMKLTNDFGAVVVHEAVVGGHVGRDAGIDLEIFLRSILGWIEALDNGESRTAVALIRDPS